MLIVKLLQTDLYIADFILIDEAITLPVNFPIVHQIIKIIIKLLRRTKKCINRCFYMTYNMYSNVKKHVFLKFKKKNRLNPTFCQLYLVKKTSIITLQ